MRVILQGRFSVNFFTHQGLLLLEVQKNEADNCKKSSYVFKPLAKVRYRGDTSVTTQLFEPVIIHIKVQ